MPRMVRDRTGRFPERPHFEPTELDVECEKIVSDFLLNLYGEVVFPIRTDDLTKLVEQDAGELDLYAEVSQLGSGIDGVTDFYEDRKPLVRIAKNLSINPRRENRLRTTLTHEYGHVRFHTYLWSRKAKALKLFESSSAAGDALRCKRSNLLDAPEEDWMEWQAGYACGAILMPISRITQVVREHRTEHRISGDVESDSSVGHRLVAAVSQAFGVSEEAARVRLEKLRLLKRGRSTPALLR